MTSGRRSDPFASDLRPGVNQPPVRRSHITRDAPAIPSRRRRPWVTSPCQHSLGKAASKRISDAWGRFAGWASTKPRRESTRQVVDAEGTSFRRCAMCQAIVRAPASRPVSTRSLRRATISSSRSSGSDSDDCGGAATGRRAPRSRPLDRGRAGARPRPWTPRGPGPPPSRPGPRPPPHRPRSEPALSVHPCL